MPADIFEQQVKDEPVTDTEWLEYQFFVALHNLKRVAPSHYLVTTIEMALKSRAIPSNNKPGLMRHQAD